MSTATAQRRRKRRRAKTSQRTRKERKKPRPNEEPRGKDEQAPNTSEDANRCSFSLDMRRGLAPKEVERRFIAGHRAGDLGRRVAAHYAAEVTLRGTHELRGYGDLNLYAEQRLGVSRKTFQQYARVGRRLLELSDIDRLFAEGALCYSVVRLLTPIVTPETQRAWGEWATGKRESEVRAQTRGRQRGDLPTDSSKRRIHTVTTPFSAKLSPAQVRRLEVLQAEAERELGGPLTQQDMLVWLFVRAWNPAWASKAKPRPDLDPLNYQLEVPRELRDRPTPKSLREEIKERDGHRCVSCGRPPKEKETFCVHHIVWRRFGGRTVAENLVTLCEDCHSLVHARYLILVGTAGDLRILDDDGEPRDFAPLPPVRCKLPEELASPPELQLDADPPLPAPPVVEAPPAKIDSAWLRRHEHLLRWDRQRGGLEFRPGRGRSPADAQEASSPPPGPGLAGLVGQERARENLTLAVEASRQSGEPVGHTLLAGPPGLGKSSLARALAHDVGARLHTIMTPALRDREPLLRQLLALQPGDVLFLDEIHRLPAPAAELLYDALERGQLNLPLTVRGAGETGAQRTLCIEVAPFTLVGATTEPHLLPSPLLSRFVYCEQLDFYSEEPLGVLAARAARAEGFELTTGGRASLAAAAQNTPRGALALLRAAQDQARAERRQQIDERVVKETLLRTGREPNGFDSAQRAYLNALAASGGCAGIASLAARLGVSRRTVQRVIEPFLLRRGLVRLTPRGRMLAAGALSAELPSAQAPPEAVDSAA